MRFKLFESPDDIERLLKINKPRLVRAGKSEICIVRNSHQLIAFYNQCPHMGAQLHQGVVNIYDEIVCPLHTYKFNLITGEEEGSKCKPLTFVQVVIEERGVFLAE